MSFTTEQAELEISHSMGAMLLLHASNQALIEVSITPSNSSWYKVLNSELGAAENLVVEWRQNGFLYFQQDILQQIISCGTTFLAAKTNIDTLFEELTGSFSQTTKQDIVHGLMALSAPVENMISQIGAYLAKLQAFEVAMQQPYGRMNETVAKIQAQEADIQAEIKSINAQIASLKTEVVADRKAIAKAKHARDVGIGETIFGVILAPFTGGLSLILAGIGVASIAEGEAKVKQLESTISKYQTQIVGDQTTLSSDQKQIATLKGLTMSVELALTDIADIETALDSLRTTWNFVQGALQGAVNDVQNSTTAKEALVSQVWFNASCGVWQEVVTFCQQLANNNAPTPNRITIGN